jgi:hypothetical protein
VFWTTRIACLRKDRLNLSCGDSHYNAYGLQAPWILEWNEDFFAGSSSAVSGVKISTALS